MAYTANKFNVADHDEKFTRLRWNWFYIVLASSLVSLGSSSPLGTFHQFLTNPNAETMKEAHMGNLVSVKEDMWSQVENLVRFFFGFSLNLD